MGMFDYIEIPCPNCGARTMEQTKGGDCVMATLKWETATDDEKSDIERRGPFKCECGKSFNARCLGYELVIVADVEETPAAAEGR